MKLYLVRHGETDAKEKGKRQTPDSPLSQKGKEQAEATGERLAKEEFDFILSSRWPRAKQTAQIIAQKTHKKTKYLDNVHERKHDPKLAGLELESKLNNQYSQQMNKNYQDLDWKFLDGCESLREAMARAKNVKDFLLKNFFDKTLVLVTHGIFLRCLWSICVLGKENQDGVLLKLFHTPLFDNASISLIWYDEKHQLWRTEYLNNTEHLIKLA
ncbi:MAG TPA: histidine phosphatase family protein [Clostridia bacterium]|nr:histidine phosphatase family protein [Clostridia bacterium]